MQPARTEVGTAEPATAVVVDLRGFTLELNESRDEDGSRARFCDLLAEMNAAVVDCSWAALPPALRLELARWVYVGATGDGALIVFLHPEDHVQHAWLCALLLRARLHRACRAYLVDTSRDLDFGIGVETGNVRSVGAFGEMAALSTLIGSCINLASRIQGMTKTITRTRIIYGQQVVDALLERLFPDEWAVVGEEPMGWQSDADYLEAKQRRISLNRRLCVSFLHVHNARGFPEPRAVFRLSRSSAAVGNPRFDGLIERLTREGPWRDEVFALLD